MGMLKFGTNVLKGIGNSKKSTMMFGAGMLGLGIANASGPTARDAFLDVTTGTPDADKYFIGDKLSGRYLLGSAMGGPAGGALKITDPKNIARFDLAGMGPAGSPMRSSKVGGLGGGVMGGILGAMRGSRKGLGGAIRGGILGAGAGGVLGSVVGGGATMAANPGTGSMAGAGVGGIVGAAIGLAVGSRKGFAGAIKGGILGAGIGGTTGGAFGAAAPLAMTAHHVGNNKKFYSESPYARTSAMGYNPQVSQDVMSAAVRNIVPDPSYRSSSLETAQQLNASGNIVLGMHNSRRGY